MAGNEATGQSFDEGGDLPAVMGRMTGQAFPIVHIRRQGVVIGMALQTVALAGHGRRHQNTGGAMTGTTTVRGMDPG